MSSIYFDQPHPHHPSNRDNLRAFLTHLYLDCMMRYQNYTWQDNQTDSNEVFFKSVPRYLEEAAINEGFIDMDNVDEAAAENEELFATISTIILSSSSSSSAATSASIPLSSIVNMENHTNSSYFDFDEDDNRYSTSSKNIFCPLRFDGYLCWPRTPAGTILSQYCPDFVEGFNHKLFAHKTCLENGTWYHHPISGQEWSNYTNCIDYEDLEFRSFVNELYVKGYAISLGALLLSLIIFLGFKSLRCTRIRIHVHLFASLAFTCISWILWYKLVVEKADMIRDNSHWCIGQHLIVHYFMLVNYFWMFCEGLHLHLVLVVVFVKDTIVMRWFKLLSWVSPLAIVAGYSVARYFRSSDNIHCWMDDSVLLWIFSVPICLSLFASFVFLINVLRVIVRKLHPQSTQPAPLAIRKAVRATIILIPLFGLQHFLLPYRPSTGTQLERAYQIMSVVLVSLQGFVVSFLFCFANHDVAFAIRSMLNRLMPRIVSPPPPSSNTGQMATTTPSRELGV